MNLTRYKPQAIAVFHTEKGDLVTRATSDPNSNIDDDIVEIVTTRDMGADAPTFSIVLTRRKLWNLWVASNDLVTIIMHRPPEDQAVVFVGLVDDVRNTVNVNEDSVMRTTTISGRGVNKSFIAFDIGVVPETGGKIGTPEDGKSGWLQSAGVNIIGMTPKNILSAMWEVIGRKYVNYEWSNGKKLFDVMQHQITDRPGMVLIDAASVINFQGSLWAFVKEVAENPFYEVFWEIVNNIPTMVCRPTPFSKDSWNSLPRIRVTDEDVVTDDIGRSDLETYTIYSVGSKTFISGGADPFKTFGNLPIWYEPYFKKYGIRRLHSRTMYAATAAIPDAKMNGSVLRQLQIDLYNWNIKNNSMFNGTMVVKGKNTYKIGTILEYPSVEGDIGLEFYIKSVSHKFTNFGQWVTQLGLIRGSEPQERFTAPYDAWTEAKNIGWQPFKPSGTTGGKTAGMRNSIKPMGGQWAGKGQATANKAIEMMNANQVRYVLGGTSTDTNPMILDCASWTQYVYSQVAGYDIGSNCLEQINNSQVTMFNDQSKAEPGDLVFFHHTYIPREEPGYSGPTHVGIIIDKNGTFVHNSSTADGLVSANLSNSYWSDHYYGCGRVYQDSTGRDMKFEATAYGGSIESSMGGSGDGITYCGSRAKEGRTIAADLDILPLYTKVSIECPDDASVNGEYIVEDIGGAIKGNLIDIYFEDLSGTPEQNIEARKRMSKFGRKNIYVTIVGREVPADATREV